MSMISAQCDELRNAADELDERAKAYGPLAHNVLSPMLRSAADTIWEMRNKLAGTVDQSEEIERLKEQVHWLKKGDVLHVLTDQEFADQQKREREMQASIAALEEENAKLDCIRRSLHADVLWLGGIIHRQRKQLAEVQGAPERRNDENAKLRELVRELWEGYNDPRCEECHLKDTPTCVDCPICAREAAVIDRMRELGVEVPGDGR